MDIVKSSADKFNSKVKGGAQEIINKDEMKWKAIINRIDKKGDGKVSLDDFTKAIKEFIDHAYDTENKQ